MRATFGPATDLGPTHEDAGGVVNNAEIGNDMLKLGHAQITSSLNVLGNECNDLISAETAMMVRVFHQAVRHSQAHHRVRRVRSVHAATFTVAELSKYSRRSDSGTLVSRHTDNASEQR